MKKLQRQKLLEKIDQTIIKLVERNENRRKRKRMVYAAIYSKAALGPELWKVVYAKIKQGVRQHVE